MQLSDKVKVSPAV